MELAGVIQAIDCLIHSLRRVMKPEKGHVGFLCQRDHASVSYQPTGMIGIMAL